MQQYPINQEPRFCYKCHYPAAVSDAKCPRCGGPLKTRKNIRILGGVLVFLGGLISAIMVVVLAVMLGIFSQTPASRMKGEEHMVFFALGIVGLTFAVGVAFIAAGVWQMIFGKRNGLIVWIAVGMVVVLLVVGRIFTSLS